VDVTERSPMAAPDLRDALERVITHFDLGEYEVSA
jgi:hypothetical protein